MESDDRRAVGCTPEFFNELAVQLAGTIVRKPMAQGGKASHVLVLLESVVVGVLGELAPAGKGGPLMDAIAFKVKERLAKVGVETSH